jgi:hypothetical protein
MNKGDISRNETPMKKLMLALIVAAVPAVATADATTIIICGTSVGVIVAWVGAWALCRAAAMEPPGPPGCRDGAAGAAGLSLGEFDPDAPGVVDPQTIGNIERTAS